MIYRGRIQGGMVVFDDPDAKIPEGTPVNVEPLATRAAVETERPAPSAGSGEAEELDPLFTMGDLAVETGIPDLSVNIDHYLYGHPKVEDDGSR